ncbi:Presenilins-associated rhomboid-like protein, mitochondrial [Grifola frondosa]|uniref:Presenilins-associated rhomboid-like protein, mitochondrial n=1 Tax=Grifola frondosa TaxID=5627 RepID=A0A1C7LQ21_GRIFR|nr:Presenilins-associated rhomboid-like protein, mitochondrial [Grifola frondosa]
MKPATLQLRGSGRTPWTPFKLIAPNISGHAKLGLSAHHVFLDFRRNVRSPSHITVIYHVSKSRHAAQASSAETFVEHGKRPSIRNQVLFFTVGSIVAFSLAAERTNYDTRYWTKWVTENASSVWRKWRTHIPTSPELQHASHVVLFNQLYDGLKALGAATQQFPTIQSLLQWYYAKIADAFLHTTDDSTPRSLHDEKLRTPSAFRVISHLVYLRFQSCFFSASSLQLLGIERICSERCTLYERKEGSSHLPESTPKWHFLAFFITAGLFSSVVSHVVTARFIYPRLLSRLASTTKPDAGTVTASAAGARVNEVSADVRSSLGSSGAIYAMFTLSALAYPHMSIFLIFLPSISIPIQYGMGALVAVDILGALRGWKIFDHWAHLGGAAFGMFYYAYGPHIWDWLRVVTWSLA